ncbi:MAG TPA: UDP-glucose 4-epimerase GalE [Acetobacteraceae bacterium]|jgi:UDP-glucose 4-epimerase|nr:UDP-glucose 4-epimerase GalE [Acetobacteraceae bacterium]
MAGAVLVTGGCGYVGSQFVWTLRDAGIPVVVLDDLRTGHRAALPPGVPLVEVPVQDTAEVAAALRAQGVEAVAHFAASVSVAESVARPLEYWRNNLGGTLALLEACAAAGVRRVLLSSTAAVYGVPERVPVAEDAPTRPVSPYGSSKLAAEAVLAEAGAAHGLQVAALRYFNVAGADPACRAGSRHADPTHLIGAALQVALGRREALTVFGQDWPTADGTAVRDFVHVADIAEAHLVVLRALAAGAAPGICNVGYGQGSSVRQVVDAVRRVTGHPLPVRMAPRRAGDVAEVVAAPDRLLALGWRPRHAALDTMVAHAWAWAQKVARPAQDPPA